MFCDQLESVSCEKRAGGDAGLGEQSADALVPSAGLDVRQQRAGNAASLMVRAHKHHVDVSFAIQIAETCDLRSHFRHERWSAFKPGPPLLPIDRRRAQAAIWLGL